MNGFKRKVIRREILYRENPHCRKCGIKTILPSELAEKYKGKIHGKGNEHLQRYITGEERNRTATIQHLVPRDSIMRLVHTSGPRTTLYCWLCNFRDGKKKHERVPLEVRQEFAEYYNSQMKVRKITLADIVGYIKVGGARKKP